jgi:hypothetical protein
MRFSARFFSSRGVPAPSIVRPDVERAAVNQLALEKVFLTGRGAASHGTGLVVVSETSFDEFAAPFQQAPAILVVHPLPILMDGLLFVVLAVPVPLACSFFGI